MASSVKNVRQASDSLVSQTALLTFFIKSVGSYAVTKDILRPIGMFFLWGQFVHGYVKAFKRAFAMNDK